MALKTHWQSDSDKRQAWREEVSAAARRLVRRRNEDALAQLGPVSRIRVGLKDVYYSSYTQVRTRKSG